jgi:hypothetical protein
MRSLILFVLDFVACWGTEDKHIIPKMLPDTDKHALERMREAIESERLCAG